MSEMPNLRGQEQHGFKAWWKSGDPWIWITGGGVAISTIIVSPTARPRPIISAEKMPGLAVGSTTRTSVCQGVAPSASEPCDKCLGTPKTASSAIEKIVGMTAKPIASPTTSELRWS